MRCWWHCRLTLHTWLATPWIRIQSSCFPTCTQLPELLVIISKTQYILKQNITVSLSPYNWNPLKVRVQMLWVRAILLQQMLIPTPPSPPVKFMCYSCNIQWVRHVWRSGLEEVMRFRWGHTGGALTIEYDPCYLKKTEPPPTHTLIFKGLNRSMLRH